MNFDFLDKVKILVVGDVMTDRYIVGMADRISGEAPVPIVRVERIEERPGGAANVHANLLALGVQTALLGPSGGRPIIKTRVVVNRHQICRFDDEDESAAYQIDMARLAEWAPQYDAVIISDYAKGAVTNTVMDCLRGLQEKHRIFLAMDPKPRNRVRMIGLNLLTPNEAEWNQFIEQGRRLLSQLLLLTMGSKGMLLCGPGTKPGELLIPAETQNLVDVTGAGDTVIAAMTAALVGGKTPEESAYFASRCAAIVVSKFGTSTVTREELANWRSPTASAQ